MIDGQQPTLKAVIHVEVVLLGHHLRFHDLVGNDRSTHGSPLPKKSRLHSKTSARSLFGPALAWQNLSWVKYAGMPTQLTGLR